MEALVAFSTSDVDKLRNNGFLSPVWLEPLCTPYIPDYRHKFQCEYQNGFVIPQVIVTKIHGEPQAM